MLQHALQTEATPQQTATQPDGLQTSMEALKKSMQNPLQSRIPEETKQRLKKDAERIFGELVTSTTLQDSVSGVNQVMERIDAAARQAIQDSSVTESSAAEDATLRQFLNNQKTPYSELLGQVAETMEALSQPEPSGMFGRLRAWLQKTPAMLDRLSRGEDIIKQISVTIGQNIESIQAGIAQVKIEMASHEKRRSALAQHIFYFDALARHAKEVKETMVTLSLAHTDPEGKETAEAMVSTFLELIYNPITTHLDTLLKKQVMNSILDEQNRGALNELCQQEKSLTNLQADAIQSIRAATSQLKRQAMVATSQSIQAAAEEAQQGALDAVIQGAESSQKARHASTLKNGVSIDTLANMMTRLKALEAEESRNRIDVAAAREKDVARLHQLQDGIDAARDRRQQILKATSGSTEDMMLALATPAQKSKMMGR